MFIPWFPKPTRAASLSSRELWSPQLPACLQLSPVQRQISVFTLTSHLSPHLCSHLPARHFHLEVKFETPQINMSESKFINFPQNPAPPLCSISWCVIFTVVFSQWMGVGWGRMSMRLLKFHARFCMYIFSSYTKDNRFFRS